jgi:hypothetical protein
MITLYFILYLLAALCFVAALLGWARINVLALGLLLWVAVPLIQTGRAVF